MIFLWATIFFICGTLCSHCEGMHPRFMSEKNSNRGKSIPRIFWTKRPNNEQLKNLLRATWMFRGDRPTSNVGVLSWVGQQSFVFIGCLPSPVLIPSSYPTWERYVQWTLSTDKLGRLKQSQHWLIDCCKRFSHQTPRISFSLPVHVHHTSYSFLWQIKTVGDRLRIQKLQQCQCCWERRVLKKWRLCFARTAVAVTAWVYQHIPSLPSLLNLWREFNLYCCKQLENRSSDADNLVQLQRNNVKGFL